MALIQELLRQFCWPPGVDATLTYATLGVKGVCVVGRRADKVAEVVAECNATKGPGTEVVGITGDFAEVQDMLLLGGIDTMIVAAGVSALLPLMEVACAPASVEGIQHAVDVATLATRRNYLDTLVAAIPLLQSTSPHPSILLINSLASAIPLPTRTLYASTKAHPAIAFTNLLPNTVEGDFRAAAVDGGARGEKNVFMPWTMGPAHLLYWLWPSFVEACAVAKYNYTPPAVR
ncbi:NAD-P-binding protein [Mycena latifolia]|nr:NAD-P-binding protein [Mycena latifolia]